ncbi:hypothetical protein G5V57_29810 [Nordella sp. HKS 07]|uniref:hypothetical protein n=1 Tax=Nordella sp. HKS 07 TaxID=2712222 RepID=UPI0013E1CD04|nr:hypothetical protein [Nordella sp. HKS 07]QIG51540.1 hypothetical protein G5V57_29810 [Nordella sp. HKS 07]
MSNDAPRRAFRIWLVPAIAGASLFWTFAARAQSADDLPTPEEPWLAEPGDWAADFNDAQVACYQGSMSACDSIWMSQRVLFDSFLSKYGRTCGGRADARQLTFANMTCTEAFPGHE